MAAVQMLPVEILSFLFFGPTSLSVLALLVFGLGFVFHHLFIPWRSWRVGAGVDN